MRNRRIFYGNKSFSLLKSITIFITLVIFSITVHSCKQAAGENEASLGAVMGWFANNSEGAGGATCLTSSSVVAPGAECSAGGITVSSGLDTNQSETLDAEEITDTQVICNGEDGKNFLSLTSNEPAGANCANGGLNSLILTSAEASGANCSAGGTKIEAGLDGNVNCTNGGVRIETGLDVNSNGILDAGEIDVTQTQYICDVGGASGAGTDPCSGVSTDVPSAMSFTPSGPVTHPLGYVLTLR